MIFFMPGVTIARANLSVLVVPTMKFEIRRAMLTEVVLTVEFWFYFFRHLPSRNSIFFFVFNMYDMQSLRCAFNREKGILPLSVVLYNVII